MSSTFSGISTALSALYAQRRGLDVTGQNIANANTDGYSRQRADLASVNGAGPAIWSTSDGIGQGVDVASVTRVRDAFLEARGQTEHAANAYAAGQETAMTAIEASFHEPGDTGLQSQMSDMWNAFHDVSLRPGDNASRTALLERASTVVSGLNDVHSGLSTLWSTVREQTDVQVTAVNSTAQEVAHYNEAIVQAKNAGMPANEFEDKRDAAALKLSELTGATVSRKSDGSVDVLIGGSPLVYGSRARAVQVDGSTSLGNQSASPVALTWSDSHTAVGMQAGALASNLQTLNTTIPTYSDATDVVAASVVSTVNAQHALGFDAAGNPGGPLFTGTTAGSISMAFTDPSLLAASGSASTGGNKDGTNADALADIGQAATGPVPTYQRLVVDIGVASQSASRRAAIQDVVTTGVDDARESDHGVNLDEEMTNLLSYQRAYEAASKVLSTIDSTLDTLINNTGIGR
jgi:flagellar hook-associated protein 1 FlgK